MTVPSAVLIIFMHAEWEERRSPSHSATIVQKSQDTQAHFRVIYEKLLDMLWGISLGKPSKKKKKPHSHCSAPEMPEGYPNW